MREDLRPPETVLDELFQIGQSWINTRARERAVGPPTADGRGGASAHRQEDPATQEQVMQETAALRERFRELATEFMDRVDEL